MRVDGRFWGTGIGTDIASEFWRWGVWCSQCSGPWVGGEVVRGEGARDAGRGLAWAFTYMLCAGGGCGGIHGLGGRAKFASNDWGRFSTVFKFVVMREIWKKRNKKGIMKNTQKSRDAQYGTDRGVSEGRSPAALLNTHALGRQMFQNGAKNIACHIV